MASKHLRTVDGFDREFEVTRYGHPPASADVEAVDLWDLTLTTQLVRQMRVEGFGWARLLRDLRIETRDLRYVADIVAEVARLAVDRRIQFHRLPKRERALPGAEGSRSAGTVQRESAPPSQPIVSAVEPQARTSGESANVSAATVQADGPARTSSVTKERVSAPIAGLYDAIDPAATAPAGWTLEDQRVSATELRTAVVATNGAEGTVRRSFDPVSREWGMMEAFFDTDLPRWMHSEPPMVEGKGTPLITYLDLRQMKSFGIEAGSLKSAKLSHVQNVEAICQLEVNRRKGMSMEDAVRNTHSVRYAETELIQSGHRIESVQVDGGETEGFDYMLEHYESRDSGKVAEHEAILDRYGIERTDPVLWNFDIRIQLVPFREGGGS
jgi:hypothetical protein